jgi:hypothetical protein
MFWRNDMMKVLGATLLMGSVVLLASSNVSADVSCDTDFNGDGVTNETDLEILKNYIGANEDLEGYTPVVDLNDDGQIDLADFNIFLNCN